MIKVDASISRALKKLDNVAKQSRYANARALTTLAFELKSKELPQKMHSTFGGGATAYSRRGFAYERATKGKQYSVVKLRDSHEYLRYQFEGGVKYPAKQKLLIPTGIVGKNKYGNLTKSKRNSFFVNTKKYFTGKPRGDSSAPAGVYERTGRKGRVKLRPVALFSSSASYKASLNLKRIAAYYVGKHYRETFSKSFAQAMSSSK